MSKKLQLNIKKLNKADAVEAQGGVMIMTSNTVGECGHSINNVCGAIAVKQGTGSCWEGCEFTTKC